MADRGHLSIGEVLSLLREEFPNVTISKIRFLESQGLLDPERTPSGYRKFYDEDVERLRWILRQQQENFLPLKVIKGRLGELPDSPPTLEFPEAVGAAEPPGSGGARLGSVATAAAGPAGSAGSGVSGSASRSGGSAVAGSVSGSAGSGVSGSASGSGGDSGPPGVPGPGAGGASAAGQSYGGPVGEQMEESRASAASRGLPGDAGDGGQPRPRGGDWPGGAVVGDGGGPAAGAAAGDAGRGGPTVPTGDEGWGGAAWGPPGGVPTSASGHGGHEGLDRPGSFATLAGRSGTAGDPRDTREVRDVQSTTGGPTRPAARMPPGAPGRGGVAGLLGAAGSMGDTVGRGAGNYTVEELAEATGLTEAAIDELLRFGLISGRDFGGSTYFDDNAFTVASLAAGFARHGIEARHLRMYKNAAERESALFEQIIMPLVKQRNPHARQQAAVTLDDLGRLSGDLRAALLRQALGNTF